MLALVVSVIVGVSVVVICGFGSGGCGAVVVVNGLWYWLL